MEETTAYCGLYCGSCGIYIATMKDDADELARIALKMKTTAEEIKCRGCRSSVLSPHCRSCGFRSCARGKSADACERCPEFPCERLREFQRQAPHRAELFESARYRGERGFEAWLEKMKADYSCAACGTLNSPYYARCPECGRAPANPFVERNSGLFPR